PGAETPARVGVRAERRLGEVDHGADDDERALDGLAVRSLDDTFESGRRRGRGGGPGSRPSGSRLEGDERERCEEKESGYAEPLHGVPPAGAGPSLMSTAAVPPSPTVTVARPSSLSLLARISVVPAGSASSASPSASVFTNTPMSSTIALAPVTGRPSSPSPRTAARPPGRRVRTTSLSPGLTLLRVAKAPSSERATMR